MKRAADHLYRAIGREEVLRTARAQRIVRDWVEVVGEGLAGRSHPERYERGTLWVAVEGSAWAQELRMRKDVILRRLRERAGDPSLFTDVRFGTRPLPTREAEPVTPELIEPDAPPEELTIREIAQRRLAKMRDQR